MSDQAYIRLLRFVGDEDEHGCIVWTGPLNHYGYGFADRRYPHRVAYVGRYGAIPAGMVVHHTCENKRCLNPAHLELLTRAAHAALHHTGRKHSAEARRRISESIIEHWETHRR